ncbi:MAG: FAD-dependent thymidylate synthase [Dehalococcoidia bacterium]
MYIPETFSNPERKILEKYFTNIDQPVFVIINLPEVVKGALFARYSRSAKSLRRLFLDEFVNIDNGSLKKDEDFLVDTIRAEKLYDRVFSEYGDDSVAQLGGAHIACENASNILTKVLEWGRLASYLEQSTRYIFYDKKVSGQYRYVTPEEISPRELPKYKNNMDKLFDEYSKLVHKLVDFFKSKYPKNTNDSDFIYNSSIRAKACDVARGLLPASTFSNVGIFASGQAYENMIMKMNSHPLAEVRNYSELMLGELRKVIPSFLKRVDLPERGLLWSKYFKDINQNMENITSDFGNNSSGQLEVDLVEWDENAEEKIIISALYSYTNKSERELIEIVKKMTQKEKEEIMYKYIGNRNNRRHKPGRAMERSYYRFDILSDFGSFRDLQRHRMLTIDWQKLSTFNGFSVPDVIEEINFRDKWEEIMKEIGEYFEYLASKYGFHVAQYIVPFSYNIRYSMQFNVREAYHLLELRTSPQGHVDYRRVCQKMHDLILNKAGHKILGKSMKYVDHNSYDLERIDAERAAEKKRTKK